MPRGVAEFCLLCGEVHSPSLDCAGVTPTKKAAAPRQRKTTPKSEPERTEEVKTEPRRPSALEAMKAAAEAGKNAPKKYVRPTRPTAPRMTPQPEEMTDDEALELAAIRALAPLLHPDDLKPYRKHLERPPTTQERTASWRARRKDSEAE